MKVAEEFLRLENVSKNFGENRALDSVCLEFYAGEVHCLAGANGCGKSTLIKIVSGVHTPNRGAVITIDGEEHGYLTPILAKAYGIQVIYQDLALFPNMTVRENIAVDTDVGSFLKIHKRSKQKRIAANILSELDFSIPLDALVESLPIAKRQIIAICRALVSNARLIFMDEPTASLTASEVHALKNIIKKLSKNGVTIVFVSHRLEEILDICHRVTVIRDGVKFGTYDTSEITCDRLGFYMTGETITHELKPQRENNLETALSVKGLSRRGEYEDISFSVSKGEILGIVGLLGSGRTELALSLFGVTKPHSGNICVDGKNVEINKHKHAINLGIAYVSEDRLNLGMVSEQSVADNIVVSALHRISSFLSVIDRKVKRDMIAEWVERMSVKAASVHLPMTSLSGGNQQKVVLGKWMALRPKILILDSPTVGVDIGAKASIYKIIRSLEDVGIILISDEVPEVYYNCDTILHMKDGKVVGKYVPGEITETALKEAVYA